MNEIKQASIYLRVLWLNDNENLRPDDGINIKLDGENTEEVVFSITQSDNNVGNNSPWGNVTEWANGITYNYKKEPKIEENLDENDGNGEIDGEKNENTDFFPMVIPNIVDEFDIQNYRKNIIKNAETEEYAYYTIKMTYVPPKRKKMARSTTPSIVFNGTQVENVNFNGTQIDKVVYNGVTVFEKTTTPLFKDIILANSTLNEGTPNFSLTATTDEGMFETDDPMYGEGAKSQYFRGAILNNYVKFANFWWRIIRINGDGTVRMIYDGTEGHANGESTTDSIAKTSVEYNTLYNQSNYVGWTYEGQLQRPTDNANATSCNAKTQIENWYNTNLASYADKIADGYYCNDRDVQIGNDWAISGATFYYKEYENRQNSTPTLSCPNGDKYSLKTGLITASEVMYAGAKGTTKNASYYLYNGQYYWSMSPYFWDRPYAFVFLVSSGGNLSFSYVGNSFDVRPVINLKSDVQVTGTGTIDDPYVVA